MAGISTDTNPVGLGAQGLAFNNDLKQGKLTHLDYCKDTKKLIWRKPKGDNQKVSQQAFYEFWRHLL